MSEKNVPKQRKTIVQPSQVVPRVAQTGSTGPDGFGSLLSKLAGLVCAVSELGGEAERRRSLKPRSVPRSVSPSVPHRQSEVEQRGCVSTRDEAITGR